MDEPSKLEQASERFVAIVEPLLALGVPAMEIWAQVDAELSYEELLLVLMAHGPEEAQAHAARFYGKLLRFRERWTPEEMLATLRARGLDLATMDPDNDADLNAIMEALEEGDRYA
ncbi:MAG: hypothetical protein M3R02_21310 [Chloroflexota bacterium]|nr:hypothetical protein [Chloroflexota bacterium]